MDRRLMAVKILQFITKEIQDLMVGTENGIAIVKSFGDIKGNRYELF